MCNPYSQNFARENVTSSFYRAFDWTKQKVQVTSLVSVDFKCVYLIKCYFVILFCNSMFISIKDLMKWK